jgi:ADP-ribose pyrophosphatase YjhB (NUDIX family)
LAIVHSLRRHDPDQVRRVHARKRTLSPSHRDSPVEGNLPQNDCLAVADATSTNSGAHALRQADLNPALPDDTRWQPIDRLPKLAFDHRPVVLAARTRLRAKLSYTNLGFAITPAVFTLSELRDLYSAALGYDVSATNLQRVLLRRGLLDTTGHRRDPGPLGGRPAELFRFSSHSLTITDQFAVLRPPTAPGAAS